MDPWRRRVREGGLEATPSVREEVLERENRELKEQLAELYLENAQLKTRGLATPAQKLNTSVITAQGLARSSNDFKS